MVLGFYDSFKAIMVKALTAASLVSSWPSLSRKIEIIDETSACFRVLLQAWTRFAAAIIELDLTS